MGSEKGNEWAKDRTQGNTNVNGAGGARGACDRDREGRSERHRDPRESLLLCASLPPKPSTYKPPGSPIP